MNKKMLNNMAASATLHCLTGCAIGEILGLILGAIIGLTVVQTIVLAVGLAFLFGYALSTLPLLKAGMTLGAALSVVLAADTLSIATMELVDNIVMASIPGVMSSGLVNPIFWISMALALTAAFFAAFPVNRYLLSKGKGHALIHQHHHEGQIRGISRMVDEDKYCIDILTQVTAAKAALNKVALELMRDHAKHCINGATTKKEQDQKANELVDAIGRMI